MAHPIIALFLGGAGIAFVAYLFADDEETQFINNAAAGQVVDAHKLAFAYWNKYSATRVPNSTWILMSREEKSQVFQKREELEQKFANFDFALQKKVLSVRPKDLALPQPTRSADEFLSRKLAWGNVAAWVLDIHGTSGYLRPANSMASYYFHGSCVAGDGIRTLTPGELVICQLGENHRGLCATSVRKRKQRP